MFLEASAEAIIMLIGSILNDSYYSAAIYLCVYLHGVLS